MALFPRPPLNPLRGSLWAHTTGCTLFPNSCKTQNFFPSWLTPCSGWLFWKMIHFHPNLGPNVGVSSYQYLLKEFFIPKFIALDGPNQCGHIMKTLKKKTKHKLGISTEILAQNLVALSLKNSSKDFFEILKFSDICMPYQIYLGQSIGSFLP